MGSVFNWLTLFRRTVKGFFAKRFEYYAAGLAFFFFLSLFPLLIFLASSLAYLPIPNLSERVLLMAEIIFPPKSMTMVRAVLEDILQSNPGLVSLGILGTVFSASAGFTALIDSLNLAYEAQEQRPLWKKRLIGLGLTLLVGSLTIVALVAILLGGQFGAWLARHLGVSLQFVSVWPYLRWTIVLLFGVLSMQLLLSKAPNVKWRARVHLPGTILALAIWIASSYGLSWYFHSIGTLNKTYGSLGAAIAMMLWFYLGGIALLFGAEFNRQRLKMREALAAAPEPLPEEKEKEAAAG